MYFERLSYERDGEALDIRYKNNKLRKVCTNSKLAKIEYGPYVARKLELRIDQISEARSIETLIQAGMGRCHSLSGDRNGQYAMDLVHPLRLIFILIENTINIVEIQEITDYH